MVAVSAPVLCLPEVGSDPLQPPEALQLLALVELQLSVEDAPLATTVGEALIDAVAADDEPCLLPPPQAASSSSGTHTPSRYGAHARVALISLPMRPCYQRQTPFS